VEKRLKKAFCIDMIEDDVMRVMCDVSDGVLRDIISDMLYGVPIRDLGGCLL
jgi:hypothetical protein